LRSNLVVDADAHLKVFKPVSGPKPVAGKLPKQPPMITKDAILKARFVDDQRIVAITKDNFAQQFVWLPRAHDLNPSTPFSLGSDKKLSFDSHDKENGLEQFDRSLKKFDAPIHILKEGKLVVKGGFWDGRIAFCPTEGSNEPYFELHGHSSTVITIVCDKKESIMITGAKSGEVIIWKYSDFDYTLLNNDPKLQQPGQWVCFKKLNDHDRQVSSMFLNEEMDLFATGSYDGTCNLYNMHTGKLIRCFKHPTLAPVYAVFIALSPLAICSFFSREDHMWTVFSINGTLLSDASKLPVAERASH
jgi:WD40 repeat protein